MFFEALPKIFFGSTFFSYRQLSSVEFPFALFLSVPDEYGSGCLHENFLIRFLAEPTSRWTSSGTASGSVWNGSISSHVNARPIRTVLVRFHSEPFPCKRDLRIIWKTLFNVPVLLVMAASAIANYVETTLASAAGSRSHDNSSAATNPKS